MTKTLFVGLVVVLFACVSMGGGEVGRSTSGPEVSKFELIRGALVKRISATVIDYNFGNEAATPTRVKQSTQVEDLCFFDPANKSNWVDGREVGLNYVNAQPVETSGQTELKLDGISSITIIEDKEDQERKRKFVRVEIVAKDEKGADVKREFYIPRDVWVGYKYKFGKEYVQHRVLLERLERIENIKVEGEGVGRDDGEKGNK